MGTRCPKVESSRSGDREFKLGSLRLPRTQSFCQMTATTMCTLPTHSLGRPHSPADTQRAKAGAATPGPQLGRPSTQVLVFGF